MSNKEEVNILWFRNGLRLHDNHSLHAAVSSSARLLPIFIFDGETPTTKMCNYNKARFLLECLEDLDKAFRQHGGRLYCLQGRPDRVIKTLLAGLKVSKLCFDQDCEPIWMDRDNRVKDACDSSGVEVVEPVGATLWDPFKIIEANGGTPPLTYTHFCHVTKGVGPPPRPVDDVDLAKVTFAELPENLLADLKTFPGVPRAEDLGIATQEDVVRVWTGGESVALKFFKQRVEHEKNAFLDGSFLPNRRNPDILCPPKSLAPDLKFGCLSVRLFYWSIMDAYEEVTEGNPPASYIIVSQLIWREFFYAMSANNPYYAEMERNPICINVPWKEDRDLLQVFLDGRTGYPFIDAGVAQLKLEGWVHHIVRNALSMFLTRGDLWLSWEHGFKLFMEYLIDADWCVCAGNWMWVSSSAFEKALNTSTSLDPGKYGRRVDPYGDYIKKYVPQLKDYPVDHIYEPWKAPLEVQRTAGCIIGTDYPAPVVKHQEAVEHNNKQMVDLQNRLLMKFNMEEPNHIKPSNKDEIRSFFRVPEI